MGLKLVIVLTLVLYQEAFSSDIMEGGAMKSPLKPTIAECGKAFHVILRENKVFKLAAPPYIKGSAIPNDSRVDCTWTFIGEPGCTTEMFCSEFDIGGSSQCGEEYLEVSDGTGGRQRFCGNVVFEKPIKPSKKLRDLFITFKSSKLEALRMNGFQCEVKCSANQKTSQALKIAHDRKENPNCVCGVRKYTKRVKRVVKGGEVELNEFPWQVAIVLPGTRSGFCGGAIINQEYILTAAHCFFFAELQAKDIEVLVHAKFLDRTDKAKLQNRTPSRSVIQQFQDRLQNLAKEFSGALNGSSNPIAVSSLNATKDPISIPSTTPTVSTLVPTTPSPASIKKLPSLSQPKLTSEPLSANPTILDETAKSATTQTLDDSDKEDEKYRQNFKNYTDKMENTQRFKVVEIISHPLFTNAYDFDVALLRLERKIELNVGKSEAPQSICLPELGYEATFEKEVPFVVGWGLIHEEANFTTGILFKLDAPVIPLATCQNWTQFELTPRMLCSGYEEGKFDACTGDSGGPLALKTRKDHYEQIGIVSWGIGCAQKRSPGVYSRVTEMNQWIQYHTYSTGTWCKNIAKPEPEKKLLETSETLSLIRTGI